MVAVTATSVSWGHLNPELNMPPLVPTNRRTTGLYSTALLLILSGCQTYNSHPMTQTDGTYGNLPNASVKAVVWGTRQESVQSLTTWLMRRRMTLGDAVKVHPLAGDTLT